jgi:hypothetical protein
VNGAVILKQHILQRVEESLHEVVSVLKPSLLGHNCYHRDANRLVSPSLRDQAVAAHYEEISSL